MSAPPILGGMPPPERPTSFSQSPRLHLGEQAEVSGLRVRWNGGHGIEASTASTVSCNTAYMNGIDGIFAGSGSTVRGNTSRYVTVAGHSWGEKGLVDPLASCPRSGRFPPP